MGDSGDNSNDIGLDLGFDVGKPHPARVYDFLLDGKDNFAADRAAADEFLAAVPGAREVVRANRAFLGRAVRYLAADAGIRQFLDVGTGIPTAANTHEIAQTVASECRIVYVDNDPIVLAHARALLSSDPRGRTTFIDADLRDPTRILNAPATGELIDFERPVGLVLLAVLHLIPDSDDPYGIVRTLVDALPSGSHMIFGHMTGDFVPEGMDRGLRSYNDASPVPVILRTRERIEAFFDGLDLLDPGVVAVDRWRPDDDAAPLDDMYGYVAVGRKP